MEKLYDWRLFEFSWLRIKTLLNKKCEIAVVGMRTPDEDDGL